jgi:hypothetical protein
MAAIGRLPDTLEDRCIVVRMQRKLPHERCERLREMDRSKAASCGNSARALWPITPRPSRN